MTVAIDFSNASLKIKRQEVLHPFSLVVAPETSTLVTGPNGSGKSSLLSLMTTVRELSHGQLTFSIATEVLDRQQVKNSLGYVPQLSKNAVRNSVSELMNYFSWLKGRKLDQAEIRNHDFLLEIFGLTKFQKTPFNQLSGGYQQRLLIAQACIGNPGLIVLDEPTSACDREFASNFMQFIRTIHEKSTIIVAAHDANDYVFEFTDSIKIEGGKLA